MRAVAGATLFVSYVILIVSLVAALAAVDPLVLGRKGEASNSVEVGIESPGYLPQPSR